MDNKEEIQNWWKEMTKRIDLKKSMEEFLLDVEYKSTFLDIKIPDKEKIIVRDNDKKPK